MGDLHGVSTSSASRIIHRVFMAINRHLKTIQFPSTRDEINAIKTNFYEIDEFPNVIGAVDGTLIPIQVICYDTYLFK